MMCPFYSDYILATVGQGLESTLLLVIPNHSLLTFTFTLLKTHSSSHGILTFIHVHTDIHTTCAVWYSGQHRTHAHAWEW